MLFTKKIFVSTSVMIISFFSLVKFVIFLFHQFSHIKTIAKLIQEYFFQKKKSTNYYFRKILAFFLIEFFVKIRKYIKNIKIFPFWEFVIYKFCNINIYKSVLMKMWNASIIVNVFVKHLLQLTLFFVSVRI